MKKVFYNSVLANTFLWDGYIAITVFAFVFAKGEWLPQSVINHECTHARQWSECTVLSAIILWLLVVLVDISPWWMALSLLCFYVLYCIEWLIKCIRYGIDKSYHMISFEREAEIAEEDDNYLENSTYFAWMKYL